MTKTDITLMNDAFELLDPFVRAGWTLDCAVSDVFVNRGGAGFSLCVCAQASEEDRNANKPVVAFKIDQDTLDRKELSFNVI